MEIIYITDEAFKEVVKLNQAVLVNLSGHMRWVVKGMDGEDLYCLRPRSAMHQMVELTPVELPDRPILAYNEDAEKDQENKG